jgi:hypothetical protein
MAVRKQVPYDVPVEGRCCDLVRSHSSNEGWLFRVLVVGRCRCVRDDGATKHPCFKKLGPETLPLGKRDRQASSETNPSLCMNFIARDVPTRLVTGRILDYIVVSALVRSTVQNFMRL